MLYKKESVKARYFSMNSEELPVYQAEIDESDAMTGVVAVGLVDRPAIERSWVAYSAAENTPSPLQFAIDPEEEQMLTGPLLIPGQQILRSDKEGSYYIEHSEASVAATARKYMATGQSGTTTTMHQRRNMPNVRVVESWLIKDPKNDKSRALGLRNLPRGTWMVSVKVDDRGYWQRNIKSGKLTGFSLEGYFNHKTEKMSAKSELADVVQQMSEDERNQLRAVLAKDDKPAKQSLAQRLLSAFGVKQEEDEKKEKEKMAMDVMLPDGTAVTLPDSGELQVMDGEGNVLGMLVFQPAEVEAAEAPQDNDEPVENPEDVALRSEVTELKKQVTALMETLETVAAASPNPALRQSAVKPAGQEPAIPKNAKDTLPGGPKPAETFSLKDALKERREAKQNQPAKTA